jgi:hypothetical protein
MEGRRAVSGDRVEIHAVLEEELFYPAVRAHVGRSITNEGDEEHHVARVLIAELDRNGREDDHRDAKFIVLAENVRHHIKEEENEMLPKAKRSRSSNTAFLQTRNMPWLLWPGARLIHPQPRLRGARRPNLPKGKRWRVVSAAKKQRTRVRAAR